MTSLPRSLVASLGPSDVGVAVSLNNSPAAALGYQSQLADLALDGLMIGADPDVECDAFGFTTSTLEKATHSCCALR